MLMLFILFALCDTVSAVSVDSLLAAAVGGQASVKGLRAMPNIYITGSIVFNGQQGSFTACIKPDSAYSMHLNFAEVKLSMGILQEHVWQRDFNGLVTELSGFERAELLHLVHLQSLAYAFPTNTAHTAQYHGFTEFDGVHYHKVTVYLENDSLTLFLNTQTAAPEFVFGRIDNFVSVTRLSDFREVYGVCWSHSSTTELLGTPLRTSFTVTSIDTIPCHIDSGEVLLQGLSFFPDTLKSPIHYSKNHIFIPIMLNGKKRVHFLLDSGASATVLDESIVSQFEFPVVWQVQARTIAGFEPLDIVQLDEFMMAGLTLSNYYCAVADLSFISRSSGFPVGGVLGSDIFARYDVHLKYGEQAITLSKPNSLDSAAPSATRIPINFISGTPIVKLSVNGIEGNFLVDLGNPFSLVLHADFVARNDKLQIDVIDSTSVGGVGGTLRGGKAIVEQVTIGDYAFHGVDVILTPGSAGLVGSEFIDGNIGNAFLERFDIIFRYSENYMELRLREVEQ